MFVWHFSFYILLFAMVAAGKRSFVIVLDTTGSMKDELPILKSHIYPVLKSLHNSDDIENYILIPFSDPDSNSGVRSLVSATPESFLDLLNEVEVSGGHDCPENSLTAIEKALEISNDHSNIFLFTDAPAKDHDKLTSIQELCRRKHSQIVTFLSGECSDGPNNIGVYDDIAKSCSGSVLHFDVMNLRQAFNFMKEIANAHWTDISMHKKFMGSKVFSFNIDIYTTDIIVLVSGEFPEVHISDTLSRTPHIDTIMNTRRSIALRLIKPELGQYKADIRGNVPTLVTFYKNKEFKFDYGFSPKIPRSMVETSNRPLPDVTSYVLIEQHDSALHLFLLELQNGDDIQIIDLEMLDEYKGIYLAEAYFAANKQFRISIHGKNNFTYEVLRGMTRTFASQKTVTSPSSIRASAKYIEPQSVLVNFTSNLTIFCKVSGYPQPDIWWEDDDGNSIASEVSLLEIPNVYISYAIISNATRNTTFYCKCKNSEGKDSLPMELFVHRDFTFDVLQYPKDETIEYNSEGRLYCKVSAYPEAQITWYHNGTEVENSENISIVSEHDMLLIKNMNLEDTGVYKCEAKNEIETKSFTAIVDISGLEAPSITLTKSDQNLKPGDWLEVECNVISGNPPPELTWKKVLGGDFVDIPEGVHAEGKTFKIPSAKSEHGGVYKCEAKNIQGEDAKEIVIKVQYPPIIRNGDEIKMVKVGDLVDLLCEVDAEPKAVVRWDMYQDDVIIAFDERHYTYGNNIHRFEARPWDSGNYHCIAENDMGRAVRTVTVNVFVPPFIELLEYKNKSVQIGGSLLLTCNISLGHPVPTTRWEFVSTRSGVTVLSRNTTTKLDLVLTNLSKKDEGTYQCIAENEVGIDSIKIFLKVQR